VLNIHMLLSHTAISIYFYLNVCKERIKNKEIQ